MKQLIDVEIKGGKIVSVSDGIDKQWHTTLKNFLRGYILEQNCKVFLTAKVKADKNRFSFEICVKNIIPIC